MTLLEKLKAATEGSRGLDGLIARDIEGWLPYFDLDGDDLLDWPDMGGHWHQPGDLCDHSHSVDCSKSGPHRDPPHYTTSIDAALALMERVRPGSEWDLTNIYGGSAKFHEQIRFSMDLNSDYPIYESACTIPLAICLALVKAADHD